MKRQLPHVSAVIALTFAAVPVEAVQVVLSPTRDTVIYSDPGGALANGAGEFLFAGQNGPAAGNQALRSLLFFDLTTVPAGAVINSVSLELTAFTPNPFGDRGINLHRLLDNWGEGSSDAPDGEGKGAASTPGDATWIHRFFGTDTWTNPGGDFAGAASASKLVGIDGTYSWSDPGLAADVQGFVDGSSGNFGWILIGDEGEQAKRFHSGDGGNPGAPRLTVDYTPVPETGTAALLFGGLLLLNRRRGN